MAEVAKWGALGYEQVPGLANRIISRYLRTQRHNMLRFFLEHGFLDLAERMRQIKLSRQGMMAKNRMFQKVLDDYTKRTTPQPIAEASPVGDPRSRNLGMPNSSSALDGNRSGNATIGVRTDTADSVPEMEKSDSDGIVIEE